MKSVMQSFLPSTSAVKRWLCMPVVLVAIGIFSGCTNYGPMGTSNFDPTYSRTLDKGETLRYSTMAEVIIGSYMEGEEEPHPSTMGVLLLTNERMMFAKWNGKEQRYEPVVWTDYPHIAQVKKHNNILLKYIAIVATDGSKFTYLLGSKSVEQAYDSLMESIRQNHRPPVEGEQI